MDSPATTTTPTETQATVPASWPGAFGLYKFSKAAVKVNLWVILTLIIIDLIALIISAIFDKYWEVQIIASTINGVAGLALSILYLAGVRNNKLSLEQAVRGVFTKILWLRAFASSLITSLLLLISFTPSVLLLFLSLSNKSAILGVISFLLVVLPLLLIPRLAFAPYFVIDGDGPITSVKASLALTKNNALKIYTTYAVTFLIAVLAITIIGIPFAIYMYFMYAASLPVTYQLLRNKAPATDNTPPAATSPAA